MNQYPQPNLYPLRIPSQVYGHISRDNSNADFEADAGIYDDLEMNLEAPHYASVSDHVFGVQSRQTEILSAHTGRMIEERQLLHKRHMYDIQVRHLEIQYQMNGAALHASSDGHKREMLLQGTLLKLDTERRKEELAYWKDMAELKGTALELAGEAYSLGQRRSLLDSLEGVLDG